MVGIHGLMKAAGRTEKNAVTSPYGHNAQGTALRSLLLRFISLTQHTARHKVADKPCRDRGDSDR